MAPLPAWRGSLLLPAIALPLLLYLPGLGRPALLDYDESGYAAVAAETFRSADPLTLMHGGMPWFDKPPLYFWLSGAAQEFVPSPELASRLPAAFAGIACAALVFLIVEEATGNALAAFLASALLSTSSTFIDLSRQGRVDTLVIALSLLSAYAWMRAGRSPRWYLLAGIAIGLAILAKSVVALLALPLLLAWSIAMCGWRSLLSRWVAGGALLTLAVAVPWHAYETWRYGMAFWQGYLFHNVLSRFGSDLLGAGTNRQYLVYLASAAPLLSGAFLLACAVGIARRSRPVLLFAGGTLFVLAVFFAAHTKVVYYLALPLAFGAAAAGLAFHELVPRPGRRLAAAALALIVLSVALGLYAYRNPGPDLSYERAAAEDEKAIGTMLRSVPGPVYFTAPAYWETVRYYSGGKVLEAWTPEALRPAYIVVHRGHERPLSSLPAALLYKGTEASLYRVP